MDQAPASRIIRAREFTAERAWGAASIANMDGTTVRLHWTDQPYKWHVNDGEEVFAVLDGVVDMHVREGGVEQVHTLEVGDVFYAGLGCEHVAHPRGAARILVIEREGSV
ncbi:MAG: cupin domain-containing protein [Gammaproteobacteria bacterium]